MTDPKEPLISNGINREDALDLLSNSKPVEVIVGEGPSAATWYLPRALLVQHSPFFAAALEGQFMEASTLKISLPEDNPSRFKNFVQWLYLGYFKLGVNGRSSKLAGSWILGDKLDCQMFQDHVMLRLMLHQRRLSITPATIKIAYDGTVPGSKLRLYIVAKFLYSYRVARPCVFYDDQQRMFEDLDEFAKDVVNRMLVRDDSEFPDPRLDPYAFLRAMNKNDVNHFEKLEAEGNLD